MFWRHPILSLSTLAYLGLVGWVTLSPSPYGQSTANLLDRVLTFFARHEQTAWLDFSTVERLANVAMFVPVGIFLLLVVERRFWWLAILLGAAFSGLIELLQGQLLPTRVSDPFDIVMNTIGTVIGVILALLITAGTERYYRKSERQAQQLEAQQREIERLRSRLNQPPPAN